MSSPPSATSNRPGWSQRLLGYARRHRGLVLGAGVAAGGVALLGVAVPLVVRHVVDLVVADSGRSIWPWVGVLVLVALVQFGANYARRISAARLAFSIQHDMRRDLFGALTRLDGAGQDALDTGQVVSRSITDLAVAGGVLVMVPAVAGAVLLVVLALVAMAVLSPS